MRIELFGLPAVGKTFYIQQFVKKYPQYAPLILPNRPASKWETMQDIPFYLKNLSLTFKARNEFFKSDIFTRLKRIARRSSYISQHDNCILVECGLLQPLLELIILWDDENDIRWTRYFKRVISTHHHYILFTDRLESILQREIQRHPRRFSMSYDELRPRYDKAQSCLELLKTWISVDEIDLQKSNDQSVLQKLHEIFANKLQIADNPH